MGEDKYANWAKVTIEAESIHRLHDPHGNSKVAISIMLWQYFCDGLDMNWTMINC